MKKKLLYILPEYDADAPTHHVHIFEMLERLGMDMDIFLLVEKSISEPKIKNLKKIYVPRNFFDRLLAVVWARVAGYKKAYIHYSYGGAILSSLIFRPTGGQVFYWHCEIYDHFFSKFTWSWPSLQKKLLDEWLMVITLRLTTYLATGTKTVGKFYQQQFGIPSSKIKIVPNWVNLHRFSINRSKKILRQQLKLPIDKPIVMFAHRLVPRKGADLLPEIITQTVKKVPQAWFFLAGGGGGTLKNHLVKEFANRGLTKHLFLSPGVPNWELPKYLTAADLLIMPSRQEGFPRILIECMAAGLPFVATNVGGAKDIISNKQRDCLTPVVDTKLFVRKVVRFLEDPARLKRLSLDGKEQVKKYSLEKVARQLIKILS